MSVEGITPEVRAAVIAWAQRTPLILKVYLFGSRTRDDWEPSSDLDVAVSVADSAAGDADTELIHHRSRWKTELERDTALRIDLNGADTPDAPYANELQLPNALVYER